MSRGERIGQVLARVAFLLWIPAVLVPGSYLLARHVLTLPKPSSVDPALVAVMAGLRAEETDRTRWMAVHVLYKECGCSQRVLAKLLMRPALSKVSERIVFVGEDDGRTESRARTLGYAFDRVTSEQLAQRYHLEASPLLVVADPANRIHYVGGYTDRKQGETVRDTEVLSRLMAGGAVEPLPVFGCAVSKKLQSAIDPLGIK
jgi:hypothetical protein